MKQGQYTYYMRCWLSNMWHSQSCCHYPLPISILHSEGVDCNTNKHGILMLEESRSWSIPRYCRMKIVGDFSILTENLEALKIGNHSRVLSRLPKELFLIPKFRRSLTRTRDLGNSWTGLTSVNFQLWKLSNMTISHISP